MREFFDFNVETGEMTPADRLDNDGVVNRPQDHRSDIDLNDELSERENI